MKPNVVLVLTDDQGYGDLGCTGNPWINTPNIDKFYEKAVRFNDFHVSPVCAPTRGALMTGRSPLKNGVWATCWGRSILHRDEVTMANVFADNGYATGMFGKWHLGDNYPYRPQDRGFQRVVAHKGGGVGQVPDFWGNNYFDDTYFHNGKPVKHEGYCTDVWFDEAMKFITDNKDNPFFCYLATNAPHSPFLVDEKYAEPYRNNPNIPSPEFYGMISNIDENMGQLINTIDDLGLTDNTIFIFMTDNGTDGGYNPNTKQGYNAGMKGIKFSYYDGGHRVPFFIRCPKLGIEGGYDINELTTHLDLLPTFIDLCDLKLDHDIDFDGMSVAKVFGNRDFKLPNRPVFLQYRQNTQPPEKWDNAVITKDWRLIKGRELYNIKDDQGQEVDVSDKYPEVVEMLRTEHETWWDTLVSKLYEYSHIVIGNDLENPTRLDSMDVMGDVVWNQAQITKAIKSAGKWAVEVDRDGVYEIELRRWPEELGLPLDSVIVDEESLNALTYMDTIKENLEYLSKLRGEDLLKYAEIPCIAMRPKQAKLRIFDMELSQNVVNDETGSRFTIELKQGKTTLEAWFQNDKGDWQGAYYVYIKRI